MYETRAANLLIEPQMSFYQRVGCRLCYYVPHYRVLVPDIIGRLYGVALGQSIYYARYFPGDSRLIKLMVLVILWVGPLWMSSANDAFSSLADSAHMIFSVQIFWDALIRCHGSSSWICENQLPWGAFINVPLTCLTQSRQYAITFAVQSHRVWIISGNEGILPLLSFSLRFCNLVLVAGAPLRRSLRDGTVEFLYTDPFILYAAGVSTLCDILITGAVFKYMYNSDLRRRPNVIQDLAIVLINMGVLTCLINITVGAVVAVVVTWVGAPGVVLSRCKYHCYVNSNLAVLNARRSYRGTRPRPKLNYPLNPNLRFPPSDPDPGYCPYNREYPFPLADAGVRWRKMIEFQQVIRVDDDGALVDDDGIRRH
ncbi:hypothetical protein BU15DRAFT_58889 [Melanogaster broomeanus]|nr:hypothetical protein BU15DRAFT_58889 [Melanogaster broomeanus]